MLIITKKTPYLSKIASQPQANHRKIMIITKKSIADLYFLRETAKHTTVVLQQAFEACKPGASPYFTHQQGVDTLVVSPKLRVIRLNGIYICMYVVQCILQAGCKNCQKIEEKKKHYLPGNKK